MGGQQQIIYALGIYRSFSKQCCACVKADGSGREPCGTH